MLPIKFSDEALELFTHNGLFGAELETLCELASSLIEIKSLNVCAMKTEIILNCVLVTIFIDNPICDMFDLNFELAGILVESVCNVRSDVIMFEYSSIKCL